MKVFIVVIMLIAGDSEPVTIKTEVPDVKTCLQTGWKFINQPQPEFSSLSIRCDIQAGDPS